MKKTQVNKNRIKIIFFFICLCLFLFNSSCGLEEYIIIDEPLRDKITEINSSYSDKYFQFRTNEDNSSFFKGTNVYYKIFNSISALDYSSIENLITDEKKSEAFNKLSNNGYKLLKTDNPSDYLIPKNKNSNLSQSVYIRLTDYYDEEDFSAKVLVDNMYIGKPLRTDGSLTFNFGKTGPNDLLPGSNSSIEEKDYNDSTSNGIWYVSLFAVSEGLDTTLSPLYSAPVYLGTVSIEENVNGN